MKSIRCAAAVIFAAIVSLSCKETPADYPVAVAHRGGWVDDLVPENSLEGVRVASRYGFWAIECDVKYTSDSVMVLMHDGTINRTMRLADGYGEIPEKVKVSETSFDELRSRYVLASSDPALRTPIPTLAEMLKVCRETGVVPMLHSSVRESYHLAQEVLGDEKWVCFMSEDENGQYARTISDCLVLLDPGRDEAENVKARLEAIGGRVGVSTMKHDMLDADFISVMTEAGMEAQSSIFNTPHEMQAIHDGATIILSDFVWFPRDGRKPSAAWKVNHKKLKAEDSLSMTWDEKEFSGITLSVTFQGELEIVMNDSKTYTVKHEEMDTETIGLRMHNCAPSVRITAKDAAIVDKVRASVYDI